MGTGSFRSGRRRHRPCDCWLAQATVNLAVEVEMNVTARFYQLRDMRHDDALASTETLSNLQSSFSFF